jgi:hypothetical protein
MSLHRRGVSPCGRRRAPQAEVLVVELAGEDEIERAKIVLGLEGQHRHIENSRSHAEVGTVRRGLVAERRGSTTTAVEEDPFVDTRDVDRVGIASSTERRLRLADRDHVSTSYPSNGATVASPRTTTPACVKIS